MASPFGASTVTALVLTLALSGCGGESTESPQLTFSGDVSAPGADVSAPGADVDGVPDSAQGDVGGEGCTLDKDCPALDSPCVEAVCLPSGECGTRAVAALLACDDGLPCTVDTCTDAGACSHEPDDMACSDGLYCNGAEMCGDTGCSAGIAPCATTEVCDEDKGVCAAPGCLADADCSAFTAGCATGVCLATGQCAGASVPNGTGCSDGDPLTFGETCQGAVCQGGSTAACTTDADCAALATGCSSGLCNVGAGQCVAVALPDGLACDDGRFCTESDACMAGVCTGAVRDCASLGSVCEVVTCDEVGKACVPSPAPNGTTCDDGAATTTGDSCSAGSCQGVPSTCATDAACDDHNPCTVDTCASGACAFAAGAVGAACDDGNPCTVSETCSASGSCGGGTQQTCDDGVACTSDVCSKTTGECQHFVNAMVCDNGVYCDGAELCTSAGCVVGYAPCAQGQACVESTATCGGIIADSPDELAFQAALALYTKGGYTAARPALEAFAAAYPASARLDNALFLIARCSFELMEYAVALTQLQSFSASYATSAFADDALYYVGRTNYELQDFAAAASAFQNFDLLYPTSLFIDNADYYLGRSLYALGQFQAAISAFAGVIALPTSTYWDAAMLWTGRAELELGKAGGVAGAAHFAAAEQVFVDMLAKAPLSPYLDNAQYYYALSAYYQGNFSVVIVRMTTLLATYPTSSFRGSAQYYIGRSYYEATDYVNAVTELTLFTTTYLASEAADDSARYYLGRAHYSLGGSAGFTAAAAAFTAVYTTHPTSIYADNAHYFAGRSYQRLAKAGTSQAANEAAAIAEYQSVIAGFITSQYADNAYRYLVEILSGQGSCPAANTTYDAFMTAFPNSPELPKALAAKTAAGC